MALAIRGQRWHMGCGTWRLTLHLIGTFFVQLSMGSRYYLVGDVTGLHLVCRGGATVVIHDSGGQAIVCLVSNVYWHYTPLSSTLSYIQFVSLAICTSV